MEMGISILIIKSDIDTLEQVEPTTSIRHFARFFKSGIPIYNSENPDTVGRKRRRRKTQVIAKGFAFHANAKKCKTIYVYDSL